MKAYLLWGILSVIISVVVEFFVTRNKPRLWGEFTLHALRNAVIAFTIVTFYQMFAYVSEVRGIVSQQSGNALSRAQDELTEGGAQSLFSREAQPQVDLFRRRLDRISAGEMELETSDDVTSTWLRLFASVSNSVKATNVISPSFWRAGRNMGPDAEAGHRNAIARGVRISRLYIVDQAGAGGEAVFALAREYGRLGVANRYIERLALERLPGYDECQTKLASIDFVVYDDSVVLLVSHSARFEVLSGRLSRNRQSHVDVASQCFDQWWRAAAEIPPARSAAVSASASNP